MKAFRHLRVAAHLTLPFNDSVCGPCLLQLSCRTYHIAVQSPQSSRERQHNSVERGQHQQRFAKQDRPRHDSNLTKSSASVQPSNRQDDLESRVASIAPVNINADPSKLTIAPAAAKVFQELNIHKPMLQVINARKLGMGYSIMRHHEIHIYHAHHFGSTEAMLDHWISHYRERSAKEPLWVNAASRPWGKECLASPVVQTRAVKRVKHAFIEVLAKLGYDRFGGPVEERKKPLYGTVSWRIGDAKTCCRVKYTELVAHIEEVMKDKIRVLLGEAKDATQKKTGPPTRGQGNIRGKEKTETWHDRSRENARSNPRPENKNKGRELGQENTNFRASKGGLPGNTRDSPVRQRRPAPGHDKASF